MVSVRFLLQIIPTNVVTTYICKKNNFSGQLNLTLSNSNSVEFSFGQTSV